MCILCGQMIKTYTKLFHRILGSSIWDEDDKTRIVWITMLASTDENGCVICTLNKLARDARVELDACQRAIDKFLAPDPASLSSHNEGRRIELIEGGWRLLNHGKFREMMSAEQRREYYREKKREYRLKARQHHKGQTLKEVAREKLEAEDKLNKIE